MRVGTNVLFAMFMACSAPQGTSSSSSSSGGGGASGSSSSGGVGNGPWGVDPYRPVAAAFGGTGNDFGLAMAVGFGNQVYMAGKYSGTLTLDGRTVTAAGAEAVFVAAWSVDGALMWLKSLDGQVDVPARGLAFNLGREGVAVVCNFSGRVLLDGQEFVSWGERDILVFDVNDAGQVVWTRRLGGTGDNVATSISRRGMLAGSFTGEMDVATGVLVSAGQRDAFFLELTDTGLIQLPQSLGGPGDDEAVDATRLTTGEILVAGHFHESITAGGVSLASLGGQDVFVAVFPGAGSESWAEAMGGPGEDTVRQVATPMDGDVIALLMDGTHAWTSGGGVPGQHVVVFDTSRVLRWALEPPARVSVLVVTLSRRVIMVGEAQSPFTWGATQVMPQQDNVVILRTAYDGSPDTAVVLESGSPVEATAAATTGLGMLHVAGTVQGNLRGPDGLELQAAAADAFLVRVRE